MLASPRAVGTFENLPNTLKAVEIKKENEGRKEGEWSCGVIHAEGAGASLETGERRWRRRRSKRFFPLTDELEESARCGGERAAVAFVSRQPAGATNGQQVYSRCTPRAASRVPWRAKKFHVHLKVPHEKPGDFQPSFSSAPPPFDSHPTKLYSPCTVPNDRRNHPTNPLVLRLAATAQCHTAAKKQSIGPVLELDPPIRCLLR